MSPRKKSSGKKSSQKTSSGPATTGHQPSTTVGSITASIDLTPLKKENESVWDAVKKKNGNKKATILAVVNPDQEKEVNHLIEGKKKDHMKHTWSKVIVTTPQSLQDCISSTAKKTVQMLFVLVSNTISDIAYDIPENVREVHVAPCRPTGQPYSLSISSSSSYCGVPAFSWLQRPAQLRDKGYTLSHGEGCYFDTSGLANYARNLFIQPQPPLPKPSPEQQDAIRKHLDAVTREASRSGSAIGQSVSSKVPDTSHDIAEHSESWFEKWRALLSVILGAAGGIAGAYSIGWVTASGFYIQGPFGLSLAAGYYSVGAVGAAAGTVLVSAGLAAGFVYLVPWGHVFTWIKGWLSEIWSRICQAFSWAWEKAGEFFEYCVSGSINL